MTIYYVDSNASGLNDGSSWVDAYADLYTASIGSVGVDDTIYVADTHLKSYAIDTTLSISEGTKVLSVNTTSGLLSSGAKEVFLAKAYIKPALAGTLYFDSITFDVTSRFYASSISGGEVVYNNCILIANDNLYAGSGSYSLLHIINSDIYLADNNGLYLYGASYLKILNSRVLTGDLIIRNASGDTQLIEFDSVDFSALATLTIKSDASTSISGCSNIILTRCKMPATYASVDSIPNTLLTVTQHSCDNGNGYYYFSYDSHTGTVSQSTTVKRTSGATYDGTNGFTAKFNPSINVMEFTKPLRYRLKAPQLDLSIAKTLTAHILLQDSVGTPVSLTDMNCILKAVYPDVTTTALGVTVSSTTKNTLDAPVDLPTEAMTFTGTSGTTKQQYLSVTIPQNISMDKAVCELWLEVSTELLATTEMFVCPDPTVT